MRKIKLVDLFAGGGGFSSGAKKAKYNNQEICEVIAAVNHDPVALASHKENHPNTVHYEEDVRDFKVISKITTQVINERKIDPDVLIVMHASAECTHHSIAKGGSSRDPDSRSLPDHMKYYLKAFLPAVFTCENVKEFLSWGPVMVKEKKFDGMASLLQYDKKEKRLKPHLIPIPHLKKTFYNKWVADIKALGYNYEYKILNSADYGAPTSRPRYFGMFTRKGVTISFPEPTHAKKPTGNKKPWVPVKPYLDLNDKGESIFSKKKKPVEKTLQRILAGLIKQVAKGDNSFMMQYYSSANPSDKCKSIENSIGSITTVDHHCLVNTEPFITKYYSSDKPENMVKSLNEPLDSILTKDTFSMVSAEPFLQAYYGNGYTSNIDAPVGVIATKDTFSLVSTEQFFSHAFSGGNNSSINDPCWTITCTPKASLMTVEGFISNPHYFGNTTSLDSPAPVIIARQDKAPMSVVLTETGQCVIHIYKSDSPTLKKIKLFMAYYGIADIKTRMLSVQELKVIQGFDKDYILKGNQTDQKKAIGNSVVPLCAKVLIESIYQANI